MKRLSRILSTLIACMAVMMSAPAQADDSEVFTNSSFLATGVRPNVLFIIDTSGSMTTMVNVFDKSKTYTGDCPAGRIYWSTVDSAKPPDCTSDQWISVNNNRCRAAYTGMSNSGWWRGKTLMLLKQNDKDVDLNPTKWGGLVAKRDWKIECQSDVGNHGDDLGSVKAAAADKLPKNGTNGKADTDRWGSQTCVKKNGKTTCTDPAGVLVAADWDTNYSLYTSSYANWYSSTEDGVLKSRFEIVKDVATDMIDTLKGVNLGLMRYSTGNNEGGMITYPVSELTETSREEMKTQLDTIYSPDGNTPLSETLYEAYLYMSGGKPKFGDSSKISDGDDADDKDEPFPSDPRSRVGGVATADYNSPMDYSCQTTYIVYLTDGLPTDDNSADSEIEALGEKCPAQIDDPDPKWKTSGRCLGTIAKYMANNDLRKNDVVGDQKVKTYFIGFGSDVIKSKAFLEKVAAEGGGKAYTQTDAAGLKATLEEIFGEVQQDADTTFVAPAVAVNAFNRSQNLNELFVSVFAPSGKYHWPGNLKKYRILNRSLYGTSAAKSAIDKDSGFFAEGSQALNTTVGGPDGATTRAGGAAANLDDTSTSPRKIYTYLESNTDLTASVNAVHPDNTNITEADVGAIDANDRTRILQYTRGLDLNDENKSGNFHHRMGDPMHARPAILIHGGTEAKPQGTVFVPTNDGVLHAFDMANIPEPAVPLTNLDPVATTERWAFIPKEFLLRQNNLFKDAPTVNRRYALDGDVRVLKYDANQNGIIDENDKAYIFFGTGRGGRAYYAIDVTNIEKPVFMWKIDSLTTGFGNLGRTWSAPQLGRVTVGTGAGQNKNRFVLLFGGGYDTRNDNAPLLPADFVYGNDSSGNSLYMVDAVSGALLWSAGTTTAYNFVSDKMTHSFPANLTALDTDSDKFLDRIYAADVDGKIWRFDIKNGNGADSLVTGGVLASLGNSLQSSKTAVTARRFYSAPDVSSIAVRGSPPYFNIAIGSGYRGHPLNTDTQDRFYSVRDYDAYNTRAQTSYTDAAVIQDADLIDVTDMSKSPTGKDPGWKLTLNDPSWRGEKALSESTTAAGEILFTTFTPLGEDPANPCLARALNRAYIVNVIDGKPFTRMSETGTGALKPQDRYTDLGMAGIAPTPQVLADPDGGSLGLCQVGAKILNRCVNFGSAIRSYWEHK